MPQLATQLQEELPRTIDQVVARLNAILDDALRTGSRIGYFAALYERVTVNVRRALVAGNVFQDGPRMERLDVIFANRFIQAWEQHRRGQAPSRCWHTAFALLEDPRPLVVQHLLLGMNAHINLDLGVAAAEVAPAPAQLDALWPDFRRINDVLSRLTGVVEEEIGQLSPRLRNVEHIAPSLELKVFDFGIETARDHAWSLAQRLVRTPRDRWDAVIAERDAEAARLASLIYPLRRPLEHVEHWIRQAESKDVRSNIQIVAG